MCRSRLFSHVAIFLLVVVLCVGSPGIAAAHGLVTAGDYEIEIGFAQEPAYQGQPNGLELMVTNSKTQQKINGLEKTLNVEIIYGAAKKPLELVPAEAMDGAYTALFIPTEAGDYTWHVWGTIQQTPVDVSMTSSPTTFDPVQARADASFPSVEPAAADLAQRVNIALTVGILGVVTGLTGIIVALVAVRGRRAGDAAMAAQKTVAAAH